MPLHTFPTYRFPPPTPPRTIRWTGAASNNWNTADLNWEILNPGYLATSNDPAATDGIPLAFAAGDNVWISPASATTITIDAADVSPATTNIITRGGADLTLAGSYGISGGSVWMRSDEISSGNPSTLTINTANSFAGGCHIGRNNDHALYSSGVAPGGGNYLSSWTTTNVVLGSSTALGSAGVTVDVGGANPSGTPPPNTVVYLMGYTGYSFDVVNPSKVTIIP